MHFPEPALYRRTFRCFGCLQRVRMRLLQREMAIGEADVGPEALQQQLYGGEGHFADRAFKIAVLDERGRYRQLLAQLARTDLIVLDDFGLTAMNDEQRRDLLEILEDRYERRSTLLTSQFPVEHWHELIGEPTLADAILDRLVHNAYRIELKGDSMRKQRKRLTDNEASNT